MKKVNKIEQMKINGGATKHYHWYCNVNNYRGAKSTTYAGAEAGVRAHVNKYPSHRNNTYVMSCTGNC